MEKYERYQSQYPDQMETYEESETHKKNRDRYVHRYYKVCHDPSCLSRIERDWGFVKSIGYVRQIRIPIERDLEGNDITPDDKTFLEKGVRSQCQEKGRRMPSRMLE